MLFLGMLMALFLPTDRLGPLDGRNLPPADLERVKTGDPAPDFILADTAGNAVQLSKIKGKKVVLVFYRGHW